MVEYKLYTNALDEIMLNLDNFIASPDIAKRKIVAFGENEIMCMCIYYLKEKGLEVCAIIDNDKKKQGKKAYGLSVYSPEEYLGEFNDDVRILVGSAANMEMIDQLRKMDYRLGKHIVVAIDYHLAGHDYHFLNREGMKRLTGEAAKESWLKTLDRLDTICNENNIRYYLCFGSLLGAIRHGGFIPWDDDVDVMMPYKDIKRMNDIMKDDSDYSLLSFYNDKIDYLCVQSAMCDNSILCDMYVIPQFSCGFPIDIFPMIGLPADESERLEHIESIKRCEAYIWIYYNDKDKRNKYIDQLLDLADKYDFDNSPYVTVLVGAFAIKTIAKKELFDNYELKKFEELQLRVPSGYDELLKAVYGDYMTPVKKPTAHEHIGYVV